MLEERRTLGINALRLFRIKELRHQRDHRSGCLLKRFIVILNCNRRSSNRSDFTCHSLHYHGHRHRRMENLHWFLLSSCHIIIWFDQHLYELNYSHKGVTIQISFIVNGVFFILTSVTICMDVEPNPGPILTATSKQSAADAYSSNSSRTPLHLYTGLFNATKRIRLKLTRYKHHLLNYTFFKENYYIPASLYPSLPPFHTDNEIFLPPMEIHITLCCLPTPQATYH